MWNSVSKIWNFEYGTCHIIELHLSIDSVKHCEIRESAITSLIMPRKMKENNSHPILNIYSEQTYPLESFACACRVCKSLNNCWILNANQTNQVNALHFNRIWIPKTTAETLVELIELMRYAFTKLTINEKWYKIINNFIHWAHKLRSCWIARLFGNRKRNFWNKNPIVSFVILN